MELLNKFLMSLTIELPLSTLPPNVTFLAMLCSNHVVLKFESAMRAVNCQSVMNHFTPMKVSCKSFLISGTLVHGFDKTEWWKLDTYISNIKIHAYTFSC
jgi:hypothetical protein